jgi:hypothetical protein
MRFEGRDSRVLEWMSKFESEERVITGREEGNRSPESLFDEMSSWFKSLRFSREVQGIDVS